MKPSLIAFLVISISLFACNKKSNQISDFDSLPSAKVKNFLVGTEWSVNRILLLDSAQTNYELVRIDTTESYRYGDRVTFLDSVHFISFYTAPCGNDCFTRLYGKYKLVAEDKIALVGDSVTFSGYCSETPADFRITDLYTFSMTLSGDTIRMDR